MRMKRELILIVDDEKDICNLISYNLKNEGYRVSVAHDGESTLELIRNDTPDLVLLDLMLPGIDGLEVCRQIKSNPDLARIPIIMVTAKGDESDIVVGLEMGASDYLVKPFSPKVLIARIRAVLRRIESKSRDDTNYIQIKDMVIHFGKHEITVKGQRINVTSTEFRLLTFLARRPGWVFTRNQILDGLHGDAYNVVERSVDVLVVGLRKKLKSAGKYIETVRGVGYRFAEYAL